MIDVNKADVKTKLIDKIWWFYPSKLNSKPI